MKKNATAASCSSAAPVLSSPRRCRLIKRLITVLSPERMALHTVNGSAADVSADCAQQGNLSMEVTDYNISCNNGSVLPRPARGVNGKIASFSSLLL